MDEDANMFSESRIAFEPSKGDFGLNDCQPSLTAQVAHATLTATRYAIMSMVTPRQRS